MLQSQYFDELFTGSEGASHPDPVRNDESLLAAADNLWGERVAQSSNQHAPRHGSRYLEPSRQRGNELDQSMLQKKANLQPVGHAVDVRVADQEIAEIKAQLPKGSGHRPESQDFDETIATLPGGWDLAHAIRLGIKPFAELGANSEALSGSQVDSPCSCRAIFESAPVAMLQSHFDCLFP